jgi:carboxymethylenebutenolidase
LRATLCLFAVCLAAAGCDVPPSGETAATVEDVPTAGGAQDAPAPVQPIPDEEPASNPLIALLEQDTPYGEGADGNFVGFLAVPEDAAEPLPGVIVLHEWWGLTPPIREAARRIAREGYIVLAVDLYGGRTAATVPEAQALMRELVDAPDQVRDNIRQAYTYLERYALAPRIGSIGWDLGGRWSLQTAIMMADQLDAAVMFYGSVETDEAVLDTLNMPLLGLFGEQDASVPILSVQEFRSTLTRLGKPAEVRIYSGVDHGFFFPGSPNYSPIAADDAWLRSLTLLESGLKN